MKKALAFSLLALLIPINNIYASKWTHYCHTHSSCRQSTQRHIIWRHWCNSHKVCYVKYGHSHLKIGGPWGNYINRTPEGQYLKTFKMYSRIYGIPIRLPLAIGVVECGGGTAGCGGAYMGCLDGVTYGSWPGQILCAVRVLARCGTCYNTADGNYWATVQGVENGISIKHV